MSVETDLYDALQGVAPTYPLQAAQTETTPRITYQKITATRALTINQSPGIARYRFQVDCWTQTYAEAIALGLSARQALTDTSLVIGELIDNPQDYEDETRLYRESFDIAVWQ